MLVCVDFWAHGPRFVEGLRLLHSRLPAPAHAEVWLDFDGTISQQDILDSLIERFAMNASWKLIEQRWQTGLIGSRECLQAEFDLLRVSKPELETFLDAIQLDPGIGGLLQLLRSMNVPVAILSDGIDIFIQRTLARHGITGIPLRSNTVTHRGKSLRLVCPNSSSGCESAAAHCKCASAQALGTPGRQSIYVGDGRSDLCPARKSSAVFAKGTLARTLSQQHIPFFAYTGLQDVTATLSAAWRQQAAVI